MIEQYTVNAIIYVLILMLGGKILDYYVAIRAERVPGELGFFKSASSYQIKKEINEALDSTEFLGVIATEKFAQKAEFAKSIATQTSDKRGPDDIPKSLSFTMTAWKKGEQGGIRNFQLLGRYTEGEILEAINSEGENWPGFAGSIDTMRGYEKRERIRRELRDFLEEERERKKESA